MRKCTLTVVLVAETDEALAHQIDEVDQVDSAVITSKLFEDASLDDEDAAFPDAPARRAMDALRRTATPLLVEIAKEVRDAPYAALANGYEDDEEALTDHIHDLYDSRVREALDAEFPGISDEEHGVAMGAVVDWAFGPTALDDVWLDDEDCRELREAYEAEFNPAGVKDLFFAVADVAVRHFCHDGPLEHRVPRLAAMADDVYAWLVDCREAGRWLPSPQAKADEAPGAADEEGSPTCPGCGAFKPRDCECDPVWFGPGPRYTLPAGECEMEFLGRHERFDLYACRRHQELVARYGDAEEAYVGADHVLAAQHHVLKHALALLKARVP